MDKIIIKDLKVHAYHGVFEKEKLEGQAFYVSVELSTDLRKAGKTDDLTASIHYGEICHEITRLLQAESFHLIERCAEIVTDHLLLTYPLASSVKVTIKKPSAPIGLSVSYPAVEIERKWHRAYLAVGSNIGDRKTNIEMAVTLLKDKVTYVINTSSLIETIPISDISQDNYLNGAIEIKTLLSPGELMDFLLDIEAKLGRERTVHWGPRTLDLDILLYDDLILDDPKTIIPHPRMHLRPFVLEPLAEIAPYALHPLLRKRVWELKEGLLTQ